jgi:hypothetical protein
MDWAVALEGRSDPEGILLLLADRSEAENLAKEIRVRGTPVVVVPYTAPAAAALSRVGRPGLGRGRLIGVNLTPAE